MNRGRILVFYFMILIPLMLNLQSSSNNVSGNNVEDWTTNISEGTSISTTWNPWSDPGDPSDVEIMSGGVLTSFVLDNADVWEYEITGVTTETIWYTLEAFDNSSNQRILSDPLPINRNNTKLKINLHYPLEEQVLPYLTPLITTNTSLLESTYENNTEYVLTIENDIIFFDYYNLFGTPAYAHHLEFDLDTGYFRYLEWIESIETSDYSVLESNVRGLYPYIRTDVIDQYEEGVCQMCILDLTGTTLTTTNTTTQPSIDASESDNDEFELIFPYRESVMAVIFSITLIGGLSYYFFIISGNQTLNRTSQTAVEKIIKSIFNSKTPGFFTLGSKLIKSEDLNDELKNIIPDKIIEYKFLMNPIRISLCKLLYETMELPSKTLKETLGISWGDLGTHTKALKDKGFIRIYSKLVDGLLSQFISLEPLGEKQYKELTEILIEFLDSSFIDSTYFD